VEETQQTQNAVKNLINEPYKAFRIFEAMLSRPEYDHALLNNSYLFSRVMDYILRNCINNFVSFDAILQFFERNNSFQGLFNQVQIQKGEIAFQRGGLLEANAAVLSLNNNEALLLSAQIKLFNGDFDLSAIFFETARITDEGGAKMPRIDFSFSHEFFYWLNFVFYPAGLNLKKLDAFIKKAEKNKVDQSPILLPLLYIIKKDRTRAEEELTGLSPTYALFPNIRSFFILLMEYIIRGELSEGIKKLAPHLCAQLRNNGQRLYLREVIFIMEQLNIPVPPIAFTLTPMTEAPPALMSRLVHQEKWEQMLDGIMNLTAGKSDTVKKEVSSSRVCYLINVEKGIIQPLLQTMNAKGVWSAGRNIALKRLKDQQVEGMTDQDRHFAAAISYNSVYYGASDYYLNFDAAVIELCGHPLLFLFSNPSISVELIKAQPEIITEKIRGGIRLKTNIADPNQKFILIKETQTRYKLISLTTQQQTIIRMINDGPTIPASGKEKLLKTISNLSSIITIHSDMTDDTSAVKTVEADSRIRVQILPIGDGLKVELFIKPLSVEPPYVKPGKGGKVVYGLVNGEKCQVIRNLANEKTFAEKLNNAVAMDLDADLMDDAVIFSDPYQCLNLLETINLNSDIAVVEWPEGERFRMKKSASFANLNLRIKGKGQWFELEGELNVDESTILTIKELIELSRKSKGRFLELKKGEFLALTEDLKKQIDELEAYATVDKKGVTINRFASHALEEITTRAASFKADKLWNDFQKKIKDTAKTDAQIPATLDAELRPYQEEGFRWMTRLKLWDAGACLADDMGLGKTVQAIAMMLHLAENGPALVVCPASVVPNWGNELTKFAPTLNVFILKTGNREEIFASLAAFDVLLITYGLLQTEEDRISKIHWGIAILDEAHAIKNTQTKSSKAAMNIQASFKLALTGTPIQNHLGELWNLFNYCNPGLLGTLPQFTDRYVKNDLQSQKNHLKKLITPFILRRTKNKVLDELPPKTEITFSVELSSNEMAFYEALRREAITIIENNDGPNGHQHLQALAEITKLRLACCNSSLVNKEIQLPSAKLEAFFEIIEELRANNHRALVFSQFVGHLSIVRHELDKQGISYQYLDGSTPIPQREIAVKAFQSGKGDLFLISLKAGGLGLNLTGADYVLHLDPWWNPAIEDQASDRAHRIGQTRPVTIYRLVAKNTIEEKIVQLHATKRDLADNLLDGTDQSARLSTIDLLNLLKEI
jgi:superfamily II DNA or RNA helicase